LSFKDVENKAIVGNKKITSEVKQKMTPKQEKYLTEKYIRPMVKKMLKEEKSEKDSLLKAIKLLNKTIPELRKIADYELSKVDTSAEEVVIDVVKKMKYAIGVLHNIASEYDDMSGSNAGELDAPTSR